MTIWIDGAWKTEAEATVSVFDHGLLYGDGIFEGMRIYGGRIFRLGAHLRRFADGARALLLELPLGVKELGALLEEAVARNGTATGYIRMVLTRGKGPLGLDPFTCPKPGLIIIVDTIRLYPAENYARGVDVICSSLRRTPLDSFDVRIKSLNYLNSIMAKIEARQAGAAEAVLLDHQGHVTECTADNVIVVRDGRLLWPASWQGALEGITLKAVLDVARKLGMEAEAGVFGMYELYTADEVMLTGTGAELVPVRCIDGRSIGTVCPGPVFTRLRDGFEAALADEAWFNGL